MQTYDIIMIVVLIAATAWGAYKGLAWQVASLASIFVSYFVSFGFRDVVAPLIDAPPPWNMFLAMLILFLGSSAIIWLGFKAVTGMIDKVKMQDWDRHTGALFGLIKGGLLCVLITLFGVALLGDEHRQAIVNSNSGYYIASALDCENPMLPGEFHDVVCPFLDPIRGGEHNHGGLAGHDHDHEPSGGAEDLFNKLRNQASEKVGDAIRGEYDDDLSGAASSLRDEASSIVTEAVRDNLTDEEKAARLREEAARRLEEALQR